MADDAKLERPAYPEPPIDEQMVGSVGASGDPAAAASHSKSKAVLIVIIVVVALAAIGFLASFVLSGQSSARREAIINDFIDNQELAYGWEPGEISYRDLGDIVYIEFRVPDSALEGISPLWSAFEVRGAQIEADQLAAALGCDVVDVGYVGNWLDLINIGTSSQSSASSNAAARDLADSLENDAAQYAAANKDDALSTLCVDLSDESVLAAYNITDEGVCQIALKLNSDYEWTGGEELDAEYQYLADGVARKLHMPVVIGLFNSDGASYEYFEGAVGSYLYDKSSDTFPEAMGTDQAS